LALNSLLDDANDVIVSEQRKQTLRKKKKRKILNVLYISYYIHAITTFFIFLSYYDFDEYSLVFILNKMLKRLKSVTKKLFGGKSSAGRVDTLF
jgi:SUMO ligase MMS21 Smc5/6 complex component